MKVFVLKLYCVFVFFFLKKIVVSLDEVAGEGGTFPYVQCFFFSFPEKPITNQNQM